ncbi:MAG: tetratricopeptide repeat protein [Cyclobacteriaceae bacterium]
MKVITSLALLLVFTHFLTAQHDLDQLKTESFSNPDSVVRLIEEELISGDHSDSIRSIYFLITGIAYRNLGDFEKGLLFSDSAKTGKGPSILAGALQNKAVCYRYLGEYEKSIDHNLRALRLFDSLGQKREVGIVLNSLGVVNMKMQDFPNALKHYLQAMDVALELGDQDSEANVVNNIAIVYANTGKLDSSELFFRKGYLIEVDRENLKGISAGLNNLGAIKYYLDDLDSAIFYFEKSLQVDKRIGDMQGIPAVMNNIAEVAVQNGDFPLAKVYLDSSIMISKEIGSKRDLENAYLNLAGMYQAKEDFQSAFDNLLISNAYRDSLVTEEKSKAVAELETQYESEKKEQQIALQQAEISEQQAQNRLNIAVIVGLVLIILLLGALLLLVRSRSRRKQAMIRQELEIEMRESQLEASISSQEKERSRFAKDLHDGFGQMISILNLNLKALENDPESRESVFQESAKVLEEMYQELKGICFNLMPQTLIKNGITSALNEFASRINVSDKVLVETDFFGLEKRLTDVQEISLYRISQEWVNNILKYSDADKVSIQITKDAEEITLLIEDNGSGFDINMLKSGKGNGWRNMNSRANLIKGELELDTTVGMKGNTLIVNAPVIIEIELATAG